VVVGAAVSDGLVSVDAVAAAGGLSVVVAPPDLVSSTSPSSISAVDKRLGVDAPSELICYQRSPREGIDSTHLD
jgi:hypothetical protein